MVSRKMAIRFFIGLILGEVFIISSRSLRHLPFMAVWFSIWVVVSLLYTSSEKGKKKLSDYGAILFASMIFAKLFIFLLEIAARHSHTLTIPLLTAIYMAIQPTVNFILGKKKENTICNKAVSYLEHVGQRFCVLIQTGVLDDEQIDEIHHNDEDDQVEEETPPKEINPIQPEPIVKEDHIEDVFSEVREELKLEFCDEEIEEELADMEMSD